MPLGELTDREFLDEYWQKKPVLIRGAFPGFADPLSPEELAGLALEEGVASRLILERGGAHPWELRLSPHGEGSFESLPETHWTLLVHEVDQWIPAVGRLLDGFRFLPNWRLDDVMVSYAAPGGNVGAHVDHYDVFLLQGLGRRRWRIESRPRPPGAESIPDLDVRLLAHFEPDNEWVLEPGDMLYLPPRYPHLGVALDRCLTYSIGFRAPHQKALAAAFGADLADRGDAELRYADPDWEGPEEPGAIDAGTIARVRRLVERIDTSDEAMARWFGRYATEPKRERPEEGSGSDWNGERVRAALERGALRRASPGRFAHYRRDDGSVTLFVGGQAYDLEPQDAGFATLITGARPLDADSLAPYLARVALLERLGDWIHEGWLFVDDDDIE